MVRYTIRLLSLIRTLDLSNRRRNFADVVAFSDNSLNRTAYEEYGQPWQSGSTVIYYLGVSLSVGATLTHIGLWHGKEIYTALRDSYALHFFLLFHQLTGYCVFRIKGLPITDRHYEEMKKYPEVPMYW
jgi:hypothetical protein